MTDIGVFIETNRDALLNWGASIIHEIESKHKTLLKVPAGVRVKDPASAKTKQFRKNYSNPSVEMTDLVGVRFVVLTSHEVELINAAVEASSSWAVLRARDPLAEIANEPDVFGYQSHHFEVRPPAAAAHHQPWLCCEVQVRTLLQHAIAELSHDSIYKANVAAPSHAKRLVARSMALMETTDELLCKAMDAVRDAESPVLAFNRAAADLTSTFHAAGSDEVAVELLAAYASAIDGYSAGDLRRFVDEGGEGDFVLERIRDRRDRGIFAYPSAALMAYWVVSKLGEDALVRWPLPGSLTELRLIYSDLGISID